MTVTDDDGNEQPDPNRKPDRTANTRTCETCDVAIPSDEILCPTCRLEGQAQAPPEGYVRYVDTSGNVEIKEQREIRASWNRERVRLSNEKRERERERDRTRSETRDHEH